MNKYLLGIFFILILVLVYFYFGNQKLKQTISHQELTIKNTQTSLQVSQRILQTKLQALEEKQSQDHKIKKTINVKRRQCKTDETAISIISFGVPNCMQ